MPLITQLFAFFEDKDADLLEIKVVYNNFLTRMDVALHLFILKFHKISKSSQVVCGLEALRFYGMNTIQCKYFSNAIHVDDKLNSLKPYPVPSVCCRQKIFG